MPVFVKFTSFARSQLCTYLLRSERTIPRTGSVISLPSFTLFNGHSIIKDDGSGHAWDTEAYSRAEVERVARLAGFLARGRGETKVWSLDKVMTETFSKEFPDLTVEHQLIDSAAIIMVKNPRGLNGVASVIPGSIGLLPSASLSSIPDGKGKCNGIYELIHGSAPDIASKGIVNPIGTILSVAMMLRYSLNLPKEAKAVEDAVRNVIDGGLRTKDMGGSFGTKEAGEKIVEELVKVLKA
ncbi:uncharacterized protein TRIVIDRAFT_228633 [Trichoderma virens Gv29-8]|uniref:Isopropylmalate dehydrogenase-like domain-containing protein n=1 Tax=Hypocrea virens (strain Gv29-8 / FGSC 10586) TaxID=413071 RepID=G9ND38_HYPVG|nr:uncharacterized protein TRIVIDRAFT_228633 [Trichoderma virens Gv29-8]EHK15607.1 hypothetical protein TRIVIDRAFT_228633 [Trichoderma virens Gv29-8]UKZ51552.1 3-isopropylmalate dehydratase [Trichoderma virens]